MEKAGSGFDVRQGVSTHSWASHSILCSVFSQFGLLYSVRVFPNAAVARPGFYAIIKFYSSRDAQRAQKACDGKPLFQTSPVKVCANAGFRITFRVLQWVSWSLCGSLVHTVLPDGFSLSLRGEASGVRLLK